MYTLVGALLQLWLVFYVRPGPGLLGAHHVIRIQAKAHTESMEDIRQAICRLDGLPRPDERLPHVA